MPGDGVGCVILERLGRAEELGHRVWAQVLATAVNNCGRTIGVGAIRAAAMCLEHLGQCSRADRIHAALAEPDLPRTRDRGGTATTVDVGDAVAAAVGRSCSTTLPPAEF